MSAAGTPAGSTLRRSFRFGRIRHQPRPPGWGVMEVDWVDTVHLVSDSRGYDGALVSLSDAALVCAKLRKWFVVGGHMVNLHILRAGLGLPLRLTHDADIAVELRMIRRGTLIEKLRELGYRNAVYPNRFDK